MLSNFDRAYLEITLEINKHLDGYIDAYLGPANLKAEVEAREKKPLTALLDDVAALHEAIPTADTNRQANLRAHLRAMDCTLRILNGETFDYLDEVNRLYDVQPQLIDEAEFSKAHNDLDTLLPGKGNLADRLKAWRKQYEVPTDKLLNLLKLAHNETRKRTQAFIDLVEGEDIKVVLTDNQPWRAYNWFKGKAQSVIEFNTDRAFLVYNLADLFAHEAYPGHHTEHLLKEHHLYNKKGYVEAASLLLHAPSAVISEGVASTAAEMIFPDNQEHKWTTEVLLPAGNFPPTSAAKLQGIADIVRLSLRVVSPNMAIKYHTGELNKEQAIDYYQTYALADTQRAEQSFNFITQPVFRAYIFTYTEGYRLIDEAASNSDKTTLFKQLLVEDILPSMLAQK